MAVLQSMVPKPDPDPLYIQGSKLTFLLGSTGAPNFKKLGAPQMFYEHPLNIKEQHNRQLSGRAGNILPDD